MRTAPASTCWAPRYSPHPDQEGPHFPLQPLDLEPTKAGTCSYTLVTSPGSQVNPSPPSSPTGFHQVAVNFLEMRLPAQEGSPGCESWVTLQETQGNLASLTGGWQHL